MKNIWMFKREGNRSMYTTRKCFSHGSGSGAAVMSLTILISVRCWVILKFSRNCLWTLQYCLMLGSYIKNVRLYCSLYAIRTFFNIVLRGSKQDISVTGQHSRKNLSSKIISNDFYCKGVSKVLWELQFRTLRRKLRSANFIIDPIN